MEVAHQQKIPFTRGSVAVDVLTNFGAMVTTVVVVHNSIGPGIDCPIDAFA
jgi:hypothetical protein